MASVARNYQKTNSFASQEWDLLSSDSEESNLPMIQERLSVGSLSSDESDAVIIFGGNRPPKSTSLMKTPSARDRTLYKTENIDAWELQHERLLSDLSKDPTFQRISSDTGLSAEKRLFEQISYLEEKLEEAQDQTQKLLVVNENLVTDNTMLKQKLEKVIKLYSTKQTSSELQKAKAEADLRKAGLILAAGLGVVLIVKKKVVLSGVGFLGAMLLAGTLGLYNSVNDKDEKLHVKQ